MADTKPRKVHVNAVLTKLNRVNTSEELFEGEVCMEMRWREPALDDHVEGRIDLTALWDPMVDFENLLVAKKDKTSRRLIFNSGKKALVCERRVVEGTFSQPMNLKEFPFDTQTLTIQLQSARDATEVFMTAYDPMSHNRTTFLTQEWLPRQERRAIASIKRGNLRDEDGGCSSVCFTYKISRKHHFYLYNILLVLFAIATLTFTTFSVDLPKTQNRLHLSILLILSNIAYRSNLNNSLPKIPYLTKMDKIGLALFTVQCFICLWHCSISFINTSPLRITPQPSNTFLILPSAFPIQNNFSINESSTMDNLFKYSSGHRFYMLDELLNRTTLVLEMNIQSIRNLSHTLEDVNICSSSFCDASTTETFSHRENDAWFGGANTLKKIDIGAMGALALVYFFILMVFACQVYNLTTDN